jgi:hypothetical protein
VVLKYVQEVGEEIVLKGQPLHVHPSNKINIKININKKPGK